MLNKVKEIICELFRSQMKKYTEKLSFLECNIFGIYNVSVNPC